MKYKYLFLVLLGIFLFPTVVFADFTNLPKEEMTKVELRELFHVEKLTGYGSVQGFAATDKYFLVIARRTGADDGNALWVFNKSDFSLASLPTNPVMPIDLGHGNDLAYNSHTNEVVVTTNTKKINILDADTFALKETKTLEFSSFAITYDYDSDVYYFGSGSKLITTNNRFEKTKEASIKTNLTKQSFDYYEDNVFYTCYEAGAVTTYQSVYEGTIEAKENLIYVFDREGTLQNTLYIPKTEHFSGGEIEGSVITDDKIYVLYNFSGEGIVYEIIYDTLNVDMSVPIQSSTIKISDFENRATITGRGLNETVSNQQNHYVFSNLNYQEPGIYSYRIQQEKSDSKIHYGEDITVDVVVTYNPIYNRLESSSYYSKDSFTNNIKNPNTGNQSIFVFVFVIVMCVFGVRILFSKEFQ